MGLHLDVSQAVALATRAATAGPRIGAASARVFTKTTYDIEADAKDLIKELDVIDTGDTLNSVSSTITGDGRSGHMESEIGPTTEYAIYPHDGTSVLPGRPYMSMAFDRRYPGFEAALAAAAAEQVL